MTEFVLTALDVTGIQRYIFNSNRLKENVGASELVYRATTGFVYEALPTLNNVNLDTGRIQPDKPDFQIEKNDDLKAEVVYNGGGNVLILFRSIGDARSFVSRLSAHLLTEAPGLKLVAAHQEKVDMEQPGSLAAARVEVLKRLGQVKNQGVALTSLLGLGVTAACQSTGMSAVAYHPDKKPDEGDNYYPISAEVVAKLNAALESYHRFLNLLRETASSAVSLQFDENKLQNYDLPFRFDDFGRSKGENSYIAVVHADVNGLGEQVNQIWQGCSRDNRDCIQKIRTFSEKIERAAAQSLLAVVGILLSAVDDEGLSIAGEIKLPQRYRETETGDVEQTVFLPFRPLVFGGDDVTFVCDGRLGLNLAHSYLNAFEQAIDLPGLSASAGVSVVKTHYPFARAYTLAEELCKKAKEETDRKEAALDWHFAASGLLSDLDEIRRQQYTTKTGGILYMRPVRLKVNNNNWRTWDNFESVVNKFNTTKLWRNKKNKIMKLRDALRKDRLGVKQFFSIYDDVKKEKLPELKTPNRPGVEETAWIKETIDDEAKDICAYFDAIEALDFMVSLTNEKGGD